MRMNLLLLYILTACVSVSSADCAWFFKHVSDENNEFVTFYFTRDCRATDNYERSFLPYVEQTIPRVTPGFELHRDSCLARYRGLTLGYTSIKAGCDGDRICHATNLAGRLSWLEYQEKGGLTCSITAVFESMNNQYTPIEIEIKKGKAVLTRAAIKINVLGQAGDLALHVGEKVHAIDTGVRARFRHLENKLCYDVKNGRFLSRLTLNKFSKLSVYWSTDERACCVDYSGYSTWRQYRVAADQPVGSSLPMEGSAYYKGDHKGSKPDAIVSRHQALVASDCIATAKIMQILCKPCGDSVCSKEVAEKDYVCSFLTVRFPQSSLSKGRCHREYNSILSLQMHDARERYLFTVTTFFCYNLECMKEDYQNGPMWKKWGKALYEDVHELKFLQGKLRVTVGPPSAFYEGEAVVSVCARGMNASMIGVACEVPIDHLTPFAGVGQRCALNGMGGLVLPCKASKRVRTRYTFKATLDNWKKQLWMKIIICDGATCDGKVQSQFRDFLCAPVIGKITEEGEGFIFHYLLESDRVRLYMPLRSDLETIDRKPVEIKADKCGLTLFYDWLPTAMGVARMVLSECGDMQISTKSFACTDSHKQAAHAIFRSSHKEYLSKLVPSVRVLELYFSEEPKEIVCAEEQQLANPHKLFVVDDKRVQSSSSEVVFFVYKSGSHYVFCWEGANRLYQQSFLRPLQSVRLKPVIYDEPNKIGLCMQIFNDLGSADNVYIDVDDNFDFPKFLDNDQKEICPELKQSVVLESDTSVPTTLPVVPTTDSSQGEEQGAVAPTALSVVPTTDSSQGEEQGAVAPTTLPVVPTTDSSQSEEQDAVAPTTLPVVPTTDSSQGAVKDAGVRVELIADTQQEEKISPKQECVEERHEEAKPVEKLNADAAPFQPGHQVLPPAASSNQVLSKPSEVNAPQSDVGVVGESQMVLLPQPIAEALQAGKALSADQVQMVLLPQSVANALQGNTTMITPVTTYCQQYAPAHSQAQMPVQPFGAAAGIYYPDLGYIPLQNGQPCPMSGACYPPQGYSVPQPQAPMLMEPSAWAGVPAGGGYPTDYSHNWQ